MDSQSMNFNFCTNIDVIKSDKMSMESSINVNTSIRIYSYSAITSIENSDKSISNIPSNRILLIELDIGTTKHNRYSKNMPKISTCEVN